MATRRRESGPMGGPGGMGMGHNGYDGADKKGQNGKGASGGTSAFAKAMRSIDLYTRVDEDFVETTSSGGRAFLIGLLLVLVLAGREFVRYTWPPQHEHVLVDTSLGKKLQVNLNITFHALGCDEVHIDAMDVAGDNQIDIDHDMWKTRLTAGGQWIGDPFTEEVGVQEKLEPLPKDYCGPCYGGEPPPPFVSGPNEGKECCNTCKDVIEGYRKKGWNVRSIKHKAEQCQRELRGPLAEIKDGEGCNLAGSMLVNQVAGNFHFAIGDSVMRDGRHIHQFSPQDAPLWNCTHTVHELSFGDYFPGMVNPLDGMLGLASEEDGTGLFQYFIKVVPTLYRAKPPEPGEDSLTLLKLAAEDPDPEGNKIFSSRKNKKGFKPKRTKKKRRSSRKDIRTNTYTYSAQFTPYDPSHAHIWREQRGMKDTQHKHYGPHSTAVRKRSRKGAGMVLPGVFFIYDFSAFMVQVSKESIPLSHLLTNLLAIAGGVFSLANLIDSAAYYMGKRVGGTFLG